MIKTAAISSCGKYRYSLSRIWDVNKSLVLFIGLNPSTADAKDDDNTITRCIDFSRRWDFGGFIMVNLFAYRATKPAKMKKHYSPVGPENNKYLINLAKESSMIVAAWGGNGNHLNRDQEVIKIMPLMHCLGTNQDGSPAHPLYLKASTSLKVFRR